MADKSAKREVSEILVHLLRHAYFIGDPLLSTERVSKSRLVSQFQRRKKIDRPYSDLLLIVDTFSLAAILK